MASSTSGSTQGGNRIKSDSLTLQNAPTFAQETSEHNSRKRKTSSADPPARRRTTRACDQCNQARTKCNGQQPCDHCLEISAPCAYERTQKKRGKAPRSGRGRFEHQNDDASITDQPQVSDISYGSYNGSNEYAINPTYARNFRIDDSSADGSAAILPQQADYAQFHDQSISPHATRDANSSYPHGLPGMTGDYQMPGSQPWDAFSLDGQQMQDLDYHFPMRRLNEAVYTFDFAQSQSPQTTFSGPLPPAQAVQISGGDVKADEGGEHKEGQTYVSPSGSGKSGKGRAHRGLRYPVLQPLVGQLKDSKISHSLASDLLEHYFASSFQTTSHPSSPYIPGFVFSKKAFLTQENPRKCRQALLASMLWLAAHTCAASQLVSPPTARASVCQYLLDLTIRLLKPMVHSPRSITKSTMSQIDKPNVAATGDLPEFSAAVHRTSADRMAQGNADDIATYIHLATVVSAGEDKGASVRWWAVAWNLAKELKLGEELPPNPAVKPERSSSPQQGDTDEEEDAASDDQVGQTDRVTELEREERRRLWWLLYIVDRHLALCYNRSMVLLDRYCQGLLRPLDETAWQTGDWNVADSRKLGSYEANALSASSRTCGVFQFTGPSIFGYFLPLMAMLGEVVDIVACQNHPFYGEACNRSGTLDVLREDVRRQLGNYMQTMEAYRRQKVGKYARRYEANYAAGSGEDEHAETSLTESQIEIMIASAYSTHIVHVLHVLTVGRWDPIHLLDDEAWLATQDFRNATSHAIEGAEAVEKIMEFDPELNFMPWLYGIWLLQGSFLLLLVADKWQREASPAVVKACKTMARAHEACVVTLNTEYQRNFRNIMHSALTQLRRPTPDDRLQTLRQRRREVLALYRWTKNGGGLVV